MTDDVDSGSCNILRVKDVVNLPVDSIVFELSAPRKHIQMNLVPCRSISEAYSTIAECFQKKKIH